MIRIIEGNLLKATEDIIGHQVNCKGIMGSGLALQIKEAFPHVFANYKVKCMGTHPSSKLLGECQVVMLNNGKRVANLFGQDGYGYGKQHTDTASLKASLVQLEWYARTHGKSVALPFKIGSDRGGADWNEVYDVIEDVFKDHGVTLYKYSG